MKVVSNMFEVAFQEKIRRTQSRSNTSERWFEFKGSAIDIELHSIFESTIDIFSEFK